MSEGLLSERVYDWLLGRLMSRKLKPGDRLNRRNVAQEVGVSLSPTLEAMIRLEWEGFLQTTPRMGTQVRQIEPARVLGKFIMREAIETQAARLYCGQAVIVARDRLLRLAEKVDQSDPRKIDNWRAEIAFHGELVRLAGCPVLLEEFHRLMRHSLFYAVNQVLPPPTEKQWPDSHTQLVAALETADPEEADRAIRRHLRARYEATREAAIANPVEP
ncbi:MAG: GntR family transcriptional regulator [Patescibacteria group bacterium]|nr:GntR family transcriptional regulator [Patescibacteria group bacterium]